MIRYLMKVLYDGSNYYGFQRLNDYPTIQGELEKALTKVYKQSISVKGAGRTDRNVHALDQAISFDAPFKIEPDKLVLATNRYLPMDIRIKSCKIKKNDFHARFSVLKKVYEYKINVGNYSPFFINYYYQTKDKIDIKKIKKASKVFKGTHDFKNFVSGDHNNTISKIIKIKVVKKGNILTVTIYGTNFYKYMVRNIVGAMLEYDKGKIDISYLKNMLNNPHQKHQLMTAPPNGLYLTKIYY